MTDWLLLQLVPRPGARVLVLRRHRLAQRLMRRRITSLRKRMEAYDERSKAIFQSVLYPDGSSDA